MVVRTRWTESSDDAHKENEANSDVAAAWADEWERAGLFDWYVTLSFDGRTHSKYRLDNPDRLKRFVKQQLVRFGYLGPFVIVPHDNSRTRYFHAHCLLADYEQGLCERLADKFRSFGNVQKADDGPIRGRGAFLYCANRAVDYHTKDADFEERLGWKRRPRKRGRGRAPIQSRDAAVSA